MNPILEKRIVLVLNKNWQAVNTTSPVAAFGRMAVGAAVGLHVEGENDMSPVRWDAWVDLPVRDKDIAIQTPSKPIRVPQVIIATRFDRVPMHRPKFSKRTLYRLQRGRCWYSGTPMNLEDMNLDHVVPRSRGGKTDFDNCRLVDPKINSQKGNRLPEEAGLKRGPVLQKPASIPAMAMIQNHSRMHHWGLFLPG